MTLDQSRVFKPFKMNLNAEKQINFETLHIYDGGVVTAAFNFERH